MRPDKEEESHHPQADQEQEENDSWHQPPKGFGEG
jgi:hypothetical protein